MRIQWDDYPNLTLILFQGPHQGENGTRDEFFNMAVLVLLDDLRIALILTWAFEITENEAFSWFCAFFNWWLFGFVVYIYIYIVYLCIYLFICLCIIFSLHT